MSEQRSYHMVAEAGGLKDMLTETLENFDILVDSLFIEDYDIDGVGKTIVVGEGKYRNPEEYVHHRSFMGKQKRFQFEITAGTSDEQSVVLGELEVLIEVEDDE